MRFVPESLATHFAQLETTYAFFLLIEPLRGPKEGYTSHDQSHIIDGVTYDAESNQAPSRVPTRLKLNTDAAETVMLGGGTFDMHRLRLGYYRGAKFKIFAANYQGVLSDFVTLMAGTIGECEIEDDRTATIQLQSLAAAVNKPSGFQTSPLCQAGRFGRGRCRNAEAEGGAGDGPDIADHLTTGHVVSAVSETQFTISVEDLSLIGWAEARFLGILRFTSGPNYDSHSEFGVEEPVKSFNAESGEVVVRVPLPYKPIPGDGLVLERGCDFAFATCKDQPNHNGPGGNTANFYMGFPFVPINKVTKRQDK